MRRSSKHHRLLQCLCRSDSFWKFSPCLAGNPRCQVPNQTLWPHPVQDCMADQYIPPSESESESSDSKRPLRRTVWPALRCQKTWSGPRRGAGLRAGRQRQSARRPSALVRAPARNSGPRAGQQHKSARRSAAPFRAPTGTPVLVTIHGC
jgi:hypothetical protein